VAVAPLAAVAAAIPVRTRTVLRQGPCILDDHVSVTAVDRVIYLEGFVPDDRDLHRILRFARLVVNRLEAAVGGSD